MTTTLAKSTEAPASVAPHPLALLQLLIERGGNPDQLDKMLTLHERWTKLEAEKAFNSAMRSCQEQMPTVIRQSANQHTKKNYASLDDILPVAKPIYTGNGFALSFAEADSPLEGWKRTVCDVRHEEGHCVRYHLDLPLDGQGSKGGGSAMNAVQGAISTGTYGLRVLLCRIFNITIADTDVDGNDLGEVLKINKEQRQQLDDLIEQSQSDVPKLLKWIGAPTLEAITQSQFQKITTTYRQRRGGAA
jgi:hypothetical protein